MGALILLTIGAVVAYSATCMVWPYTRCTRKHCEGGKLRAPNRKTWRQCPRCGGSGSRVRIGRRVLELLGAPGLD